MAAGLRLKRAMRCCRHRSLLLLLLLARISAARVSLCRSLVVLCSRFLVVLGLLMGLVALLQHSLLGSGLVRARRRLQQLHAILPVYRQLAARGPLSEQGRELGVALLAEVRLVRPGLSPIGDIEHGTGVVPSVA
eukprot:765246-Hanusia_phi.AAC.2